jgi:hypothetical protein
VLGYGPIGVLMVVEMVGIAFASFASRPFFLGSSAHAAAIREVEAAFQSADASALAANDAFLAATASLHAERTRAGVSVSIMSSSAGGSSSAGAVASGSGSVHAEAAVHRSSFSSGVKVDLASVVLGWECADCTIRWTSAPHEGKFFKFIGGNMFGPASSRQLDQSDLATSSLRKAKKAKIETSCLPSVAGEEGSVKKAEGAMFAQMLGEEDLPFSSPNAIFHAHRYKVYRRYIEVISDRSDPPPPSLLPARLLFGLFDMAVEMEFVEGRVPTDDEMETEAVLTPLVEAIMWLARHGLLYIDLRPPNMLLTSNGGFALIDYDDMVILKEPVPSGRDVRTLLMSNTVSRAALMKFDGLHCAFGVE